MIERTMNMSVCEDIGCLNLRYDDQLGQNVCDGTYERPDDCPLNEEENGLTDGYDISKIDPLCRPLVQYFNENGLLTNMSCQGHNDTNMSMYWIEFKNAVTEKEIIAFQLQHLSETGSFTSNGRFAKRIYLCLDDDGVTRPYSSWYYFAATWTAAMNDLIAWQKTGIDELSHT